MELNILIGNGINIEFSGNDDYKNWSILNRMTSNLGESDRYADVFAGKVSSKDLYDFLDNLNYWFKNKALKGISALNLVKNEDELEALLEMSKRYSGKNPSVIDIGLEDYLLGLKLFNESYGDKALPFDSIFQGICILMLDAIYNNGAIEEIYHNMDCLKPFLQQFNNIFTLNYDSNVDQVVEKPIFHLHGSFSVLHHEYRPETFKGWAITQLGNPLPTFIKGKEHLYCDAILGFSGENKLDQMQKYNKTYKDPSIQPLLIKYPELARPMYPLDEFRKIEGTLHIIGVCPNNDCHIFRMINKNPRITNIIYYSACEKESEQLKQIINKSILVEDVYDFWGKIKT